MDSLLLKIYEAMKENFVGNYIFQECEISLIYEETGKILRRAVQYGETVSSSNYEIIFVALVNLAKEWNSDEDTFYQNVYKKLIGSNYSEGKIYNLFVSIIKKLHERNKIFLFKTYTKKYYATLCSHSFAPLKSMESFFDLCWNIYCNDLDLQYGKNDPAFELIIKSLYNKYQLNKNDNEDLSIGSQVYSLRVGIKGLVIDEQELMLELLDSTMESINSLFNNISINMNKYLNVLINNWWRKKESQFGNRIQQDSINRKEQIITDYAQIKAKYILDNGNVKLVIPPIRLIENFEYEPIIEITLYEKILLKESLITTGSGIIMATKLKEYYLANLLDNNDIKMNIKITHKNHVIYDSRDSLYRDFIIFEDSKELLTHECNPGVYIIYIADFKNIFQYPDIIYPVGTNTYSIESKENDILQGINKTVVFTLESTNQEFYFYAREMKDLIFRLNDEEYKIIDGELYVDFDNTLDLKDYGVKYNEISLKLEEFDFILYNNKKRIMISKLLNIGEPQHICIFRYSDNKIKCFINLIKLQNLYIQFDKQIYYGNNERGKVLFIFNEINFEKTFFINGEEVIIPYINGEFFLKIPLLKWKIDNGEWNTGELTKGLWYKKITNTSILEIECPKTFSCTVGMSNNEFVEQKDNNKFYKLGQTIHAIKEQENSTASYIVTFIRTSDGKFYKIAYIYFKEEFLDDPLYFFPNLYKMMWSPESFIGGENPKLRIDIYKNNEKVLSEILKIERKTYDLSCLSEDNYEYKIILSGTGFLNKDKILINGNFHLGNKKNIIYKNKALCIKEVMLFDQLNPRKIRKIYIDNILFLGTRNDFDYYSGRLFVINKENSKQYFNFMKDENNLKVEIHPLRIEIKNDNSCYLGYGLDLSDSDFEYSDEFMLDGYERITICKKTNGKRNIGIDYFIFEVKNV